MEFKKAIKRISALGIGASMVGATIFGAMAADLAQYPTQYVKDGKFTGVLVVGDKAAAEDVIGVSDVAVSLQFAATKPAATGGAAGGVTASGDAWRVETSTKHLEMSAVKIETLRNVTTFIGEDELNALAAGTATNSKGDAPYKQYLYLLGPGADPGRTGYVLYAEDDQDVTADFLYFASGHEIAKYQLDFTTNLESDVDDSAGTATTTGTYLTDFEDVELNMLGKTFTIVQARRQTGNSQIKLILMGGAVKSTLLEGDTKTYTIGGKDYEVTLDFVSSTSAKFTINGQATRKLLDGETDKLSDGTTVGVSEILYQDYAGGVHSATFFLGAQKIELRDTNISDASGGAIHTSNLKIDDDTIDDAFVVIEGTDDNTVFKLDRITINMSADDTFFVPAGGKLSENPELTEPEVLFTQNWDFEYQGLEDIETEDVEVQTSGTSKYVLKFKDGNGNEVKAPIAKATGTGAQFRMGGDTSDENFVINEARNISKNDFFVLTDSTQKRGERKTYVYQYKGADKITSDTKVLKFKDLGTGGSIEQTYTNASSLATLKVGGADYKVYAGGGQASSNTMASNDFTIEVDMDGSGGLSNNENESVMLTTRNGIEINITNQSAGGMFVQFRWPDNELNTGAADKLETLSAPTYDVNISAASGKVQFAATNANSITERTPDGETNVQYAYNEYGAFITRWSPSSEPGTLKIENPKTQRYAQVFVTTKGTTFTEAATTTSDTGGAVTVQRIDVGATKLASEVGNINAVNSILVGGPCANAAAATVMGNPADCTAGFEPGVGRVVMYDVGSGNVAMLVAGYAAADTRNAAAVVANYKDYALKGSEMEVRKVNNVLTVAEPAEEATE